MKQQHTENDQDAKWLNLDNPDEVLHFIEYYYLQ